MAIVYPVSIGGGIVSSEVTATKDKVLAGSTYLGADTNDEVGNGAMPEMGTSNYNAQACAMNGTNVMSTIKDTGHYIGGTNGASILVPQSTVASVIGLNASKLIQGQSAAGISGLATSDANADAGKILSGYSGYVKGAKVNGNIATIGGQTINPASYVQTISTYGKYVTDNIVVNGVLSPPADALKKGYRYYLPSGEYVDGVFEGIPDDTYYLYNNGIVSPLLGGWNVFVKDAYSYTGKVTIEGESVNLHSSGSSGGDGYCSCYSQKSVDLSKHKYLNMKISVYESSVKTTVKRALIGANNSFLQSEHPTIYNMLDQRVPIFGEFTCRVELINRNFMYININNSISDGGGFGFRLLQVWLSKS